jgi:hypothetical protein
VELVLIIKGGDMIIISHVYGLISLLTCLLFFQLVLELCRSKPITDLQTIQPHLDRIQTLTPLWGTQVSS